MVYSVHLSAGDAGCEGSLATWLWWYPRFCDVPLRVPCASASTGPSLGRISMGGSCAAA